MAAQKGRSSNTNDESDVSGAIALNTATAVTIAAANEDRIFFHVDNDDNTQGFWVRLYPAAQDDLKVGIFITGKNGNSSAWEMPTDNVYTGEISAIAAQGSPDAYITEF